MDLQERPTPMPSVPPLFSRLDQPPAKPVRPLEVVAVMLAVIVADVAIFRGGGFSGIATMLALLPVLLVAGSPDRRPLKPIWLIVVAIILLAARLVWCGSELAVFCGCGLVCVFALALVGRTVHVLETFSFGWCVLPSGLTGLLPYWNVSKRGVAIVTPKWLNYLLPAIACLVFGFLFVLANPHLAEFVSLKTANLLRNLERWLIHTSPFEFVFLAFAAVVFIGLLRPWRSIEELEDSCRSAEPVETSESYLFTAFRNTMVTVTILFAVYLMFEFQTLWFREFPEGFYYSGYAHEGAAWLTVALGLATGMLSMIFRGTVLSDPRIGRLRTLAWIWSVENLILGLAVFNRMFIYIHFNGMTQMRVIGLFGMSTVIVGFGMVVMKIVRDRSFLWLLRRHLLTLAIATYLYALTPVDWLVTRYNVSRVAAGDLAPAVQISVHPINAEGLLLLRSLVDHENVVLSDGIRALLAEQQQILEGQVDRESKLGWSHYQMSNRVLLKGLRASQDKWQEFSRFPAARNGARHAFDTFVYQWY